jgi:hypothetical protein
MSEANTYFYNSSGATTAGATITPILSMQIHPSGNVSIGNQTNTYKLDVSGTGRFTGYLKADTSLTLNTTTNITPYLFFTRNSGSNGVGVIQVQDGGHLTLDTGATGPGQAERMRISSAGAIKFNNYDSTNKTGTPTYLLGTDTSGNVVKTVFSPATSTATSLWDLLPSARVSYSWVVTLTDGVWATVFEGADELSSGSWLVSVVVNDYAVGGTQYNETYTGTMSWIDGSVNQSGAYGISDVLLHRSGHAANSGVFYLRTRETTSAEGNKLQLEGMVNKTYTANSTISFKFIKAF